MSSVIRFLAPLGSKAALSNDAFAMAVVQLDADEAQRRALVGRNHPALNALLGGREKLTGYLATPIDEDWKNDEGQGELGRCKFARAA